MPAAFHAASRWATLFSPAGTPNFIIEKLNRETSIIMASPEVRKNVLNLGQVPIGNSQAEFEEIIKTDIPYWNSVIKNAGIKQVD